MIALDGVNSIIQSTGYETGVTGWAIKGNGNAEFSAASIRGGLKAESVFINADNRWRRNSGDTAANGEFKVGNGTDYLYYDGNTTLTFTGDLSAAGGTFQGRLQAGDIYVPNAASPKFKVDTNGNMTCVDAQIDGTLNGVDGTFSGRLQAGDIYIPNTTSPKFSVDGNGNMICVNAKINGTLDGVDGTFSGGLAVTAGNVTVGDVRLGDLDGTHFGLSLSTSNLNNIFIKRSDGAIFFRLNTGSGHYLTFENGELNIAAYGTVRFGSNIQIGQNCFIDASLYTKGNVRVNEGTNNPKTALNTKGDSTGSSSYFALVAEQLSGLNILEARCDGKVLVAGGASNISATSDGRSKKDVEDLEIGLDLINALRPVSYIRMENFQHLLEKKEDFVAEYKEDKEYGLIAQDIKKLIDDGKLTKAIWNETPETGSQSLAYMGLVAPMIKAIQELSAKVASLESKMV